MEVGEHGGVHPLPASAEMWAVSVRRHICSVPSGRSGIRSHDGDLHVGSARTNTTLYNPK